MLEICTQDQNDNLRTDAQSVKVLHGKPLIFLNFQRNPDIPANLGE